MISLSSSREAFFACVRAWDRYRERVILEEGEEAQLRIVDELRRDLAAEDRLRPDSFRATILEQAEDGLL